MQPGTYSPRASRWTDKRPRPKPACEVTGRTPRTVAPPFAVIRAALLQSEFDLEEISDSWLEFVKFAAAVPDSATASATRIT